MLKQRKWVLLIGILAALMGAGELGAQKQLNGTEKAAANRAFDEVKRLLDLNECIEVAENCLLALWLPWAKNRLPRGVAARTYADEEVQGPNGEEHVFTAEENNTITIDEKRITPQGQFNNGFSTPQINDVMMAGIMQAEAGHADLESRVDDKGNFVDDPPGPGAKTAAQNNKNWDDSEVEVADRLLMFIDWFEDCANTIDPATGNPAIEFSAKDKRFIDLYKAALEKQKKEHGGD